MPHAFSVEIHNYITERIQESEKELEKARAEKNELAVRFQEGCLEELNFFRNHLTDAYDLSDRKYY